MNRKIQLIAAAIFVALLLLLRQSFQKPDVVETKAAQPVITPQINLPGAVATRPADARDLQKVSPHPLALSFGKNPEHAAKEPATLLEILRFYRMDFGTFPAGQENADIMNAMTGNNPAKLPIFPRDHPRIDTAGNLLDAWGNPFIFHPVSSQLLEVRSKGPDGEIFTQDDIVAGQQPSP